ncbi:MAG: iron ABC transporter permease [Beijerinckiaceae bacterium]|nr:iron ABC transporter permease [Beijerinckiaceae bacterium]
MGPTTGRTFLEKEGRSLLVPVLGWVGLVTVLPLGMLAAMALSIEGAPGLMPLLDEWTRPGTLRAVRNSLLTSGGAMLLSLVIGGAAAMAVGMALVPGRRLFALLFTLSMLIAPHVVALAFKTLLGPASPVLQAVGLAPLPGSANPLVSLGGIIAVLGLHHAPIVMLTLLAGLRQVPHQLVEAAQIDGARAWSIFRDILLPLLAGHWIAAGLLAFVAAFGNFGIPALLGLPVNVLTLPTLIYRELTSFGPSVLPGVAGLALLTMLIAGMILLMVSRFQNRGEAQPDAEQPLRAFWQPGPASTAILLALGAMLLLIALVLPVLSLLAASLVPAYGVPLTPETLTGQAYAEVLFRQQATREAFLNSFRLAGLAAVILGLLSIPMAFAVHRYSGRLRPLLLLLADLPYALPGIVIAIAMILVFLKPLPVVGFSLYATPWIILLAYLVRFLPLALKPTLASMAMLPPSIEEAGALCGARVRRRLVDLVAPALMPAVGAGMLMIFLMAFTELTVSALLWSAGSRTVGVVMYGLEEAGQTTEASAIGIATILVVGLAMLLIDRLAAFLPPGAVPWKPVDA